MILTRRLHRVVNAAAGWALPLWVMAVAGLPVGATARVISPWLARR
jgi:hypothetical protein